MCSRNCFTNNVFIDYVTLLVNLFLQNLYNPPSHTQQLGTVHKFISHIWGVCSPPPPYLSNCQQLACPPPSALCQQCQHLATSPPLSSIISIFSTKPETIFKQLSFLWQQNLKTCFILNQSARDMEHLLAAYPPCQWLSAFAWPPFPPLSAIVSIWLTPLSPFVRDFPHFPKLISAC